MLILSFKVPPSNLSSVNYNTKTRFNKNYIFCYCVNIENKRFGIELKNNANQNVFDGSLEAYFVNDQFSVDPDSVFTFVNKYLDSLKYAQSFRSYNDNSLTLSKCLSLYKSSELDDFVIKEIYRNNSK